MCGRGKANEVRWQSALHDPDFLLQGKGSHLKSMVGLIFKMVTVGIICERQKGAVAMNMSLSDLLQAPYSPTTLAAAPVGLPLCSAVPNLWLGGTNTDSCLWDTGLL